MAQSSAGAKRRYAHGEVVGQALGVPPRSERAPGERFATATFGAAKTPEMAETATRREVNETILTFLDLTWLVVLNKVEVVV